VGRASFTLFDDYDPPWLIVETRRRENRRIEQTMNRVGVDRLSG
jgi:hypothetical protein